MNKNCPCDLYDEECSGNCKSYMTSDIKRCPSYKPKEEKKDLVEMLYKSLFWKRSGIQYQEDLFDILLAYAKRIKELEDKVDGN
jgi:hypothetical protein